MSVPYSRFIFGQIPWYGVLIVAGAALAVLLATKEEKLAGIPSDTFVDLALWVIPTGIIGARLYYVLFSWSSFASDPLSILYIWEGGLAIYGGVIAGFLTVLVFCRVRHLSVLTVCDLIAPGLVLAQGIGRWGNYFNQEAYGLAIGNSALCFFPFGVRIMENGAYVWHMATFFYESLFDILIFVFLIVSRRKLFRRKGDVFFFYLFLYGSVRLFVENFRTDSLYSLGGGVRVSQLLSVVLCVSVVLYYAFTLSLFHAENRKTAHVLVPLFLLASLPVLVFCLNVTYFLKYDIQSQAALLGGYSLFGVVTLLFLYGRSALSEVLYAHHKA